MMTHLKLWRHYLQEVWKNKWISTHIEMDIDSDNEIFVWYFVGVDRGTVFVGHQVSDQLQQETYQEPELMQEEDEWEMEL